MYWLLFALWTLGILAAIICPIVMFICLFRKVNTTFRVFGEQVATLSAPLNDLQEAAPLTPLRAPGASGDPATLAQAQQVRQQVALSRQVRRYRRLDAGKERWEKLGLI